MKRICALILTLLWVWSVVGNSSVPGDSVGVKNIQGKTLIVYKVSLGETAYAVSRKYAIPFKELSAANTGTDLGALKAGQEIFVPAKMAVPVIENKTVEYKKEEAPIIEEIRVAEPVITENKNTAPVEEKKETIIAEEKIVPTEIEPEQKIEPGNNMASSDQAMLSAGDLSTEPETAVSEKSKSFAQLYAEYLSSDKMAVSEKGVATWIENNGIQTSGDRFYALHSSAPVGSIVKVRNLMNNRTIYAKVIGKLNESEVKEKVFIKLSAGAAERLNVLDNRFVVEITYYIPE
ncbi:MAG: LysM peptidoglycan-binding domain-containing protein [Chitinophagales bacterium]